VNTNLTRHTSSRLSALTFPLAFWLLGSVGLTIFVSYVTLQPVSSTLWLKTVVALAPAFFIFLLMEHSRINKSKK
jgi:hypothetical protein